LLIYGSGRGLDLTDETFYLIWTRDPNAYRLTYQPFGYLLHPLFQMVRGDLQAYRLTGFAIAAGAGAFLGYSLPCASGKRTIFVVYGAASALAIFFPWIVTPSYNSAANVGALLITGGVLNSLKASPRARITGIVALAAGLCIAAFSKPPLFVVSVFGLVLTAAAARNARTATLTSIVLAAALMSLIVAPAEMVALVGRIIASQHVLALPNTPLGLPGKIARDWLTVPFPLAGAAIVAGLSFALRRSRYSKWLGYGAIAMSAYYLWSVASDAIAGRIPDFVALALETGAAGYAGIVQQKWDRTSLAIILLLVAPVAVALGTFNNQWFQLNFSITFPFLSLFTISSIDPVRWRGELARALAIVSPVCIMLLAAFFPYSLPASIFDQQIPVDSPLTRGSVLVDPETAAFVRSAHGLARGAILVDLSGTGPGVGVVLGAQTPVLPWLNPATPTWPNVVWSRLTPQEREAALFVGPIWPLLDRSAPAQWLTTHKAAFCRTALPPITFWGEKRALELWRPCPKAERGNDQPIGQAARVDGSQADARNSATTL
jgi:hypothetical protein